MKQFSIKSAIYSVVFIILVFNVFRSNGQGINVYPNLNNVKGFSGNLITFRNEIYFSYITKAGTYGANGYIPPITHLAKLDSNNNIKIIDNPDSMPGFSNYPIVYNNNLYFQYQDSIGNYFTYPSTPSVFKLAKFDGNKITLFNNPLSGSGFGSNGFPIVFNGKLYFQYINTDNNWQVAKYNDTDTSFTLIPNPGSTDQGEFPFLPVIYNGNLYFNYGGTSAVLAKYDGNSIALIPNPANYKAIGQTPFVYKNNLYASYFETTSVDPSIYSLTKYDGNNISIIPDKGKYGEYSSSAFVYNDTLFYTDGYYYNSKNYPLSIYDGTNITQVKYPGIDTGSTSAYQYYNYNNNLYIIYSNQLAKLVGNSIVTIPYPDQDSLNVSLNTGTVFNGDLYFCHTRNNASKTSSYTQLLKYDGNKETIIKRPDSGTISTNTLLNFNGKLYFGYNDTLNNGHLASYTPQNNIQVSGSISTPDGNVVKGVDIINANNDSIIANTNNLGGFICSLLNGKKNTIKAFKNNDINKVNGVTSLDLALAQSHILQKNLLNNPFKLIAADVNGDGKVTALDLVYMKRLILGVDTTFTNTSTKEQRLWAFVDSSYKFPDTTNPFPFKDSISYTGLNANQTNQTFIGVKLGDVNWDWNPAIAKMPSPVFVRPKRLSVGQ